MTLSPQNLDYPDLISMVDLYFTPLVATLLFVAVVGFGYRYRENWKQQKEGWILRAWLYGIPAGMGILALAFVPLKY